MNEKSQPKKGPLLCVQILTLIDKAELSGEEFVTLISMLLVNLIPPEHREKTLSVLKKIVLYKKWE